MTEEKIKAFENAATSFQETAEKVEDGINNVLEPEVKDARISANDAQRITSALAKRVTYMFAAVVVINLATLVYVVSIVHP